MLATSNRNSHAVGNRTTRQLQQAFKLALSMLLFYWLALTMDWDEPQYGGLAIVIISLGTTGATIQKGVTRLAGTLVGVIVGFLLLGLFHHDRWAMMIAFAVYLTVIGYFMQTSRNSYAWYVAAFVPLVVWGDNYPHFNNAFYFGIFRFLETAVGALIYTMVDLVLWPRCAGDQLGPQGLTLWAELRELFAQYRQQLSAERHADAPSDLRTKLAGTLAQTLATLSTAYADTPSVSSQKRVWATWQVNARACVDALELWRESLDDCRALDLNRLLPGLNPALDMLDKRFERLVVRWQQVTTDANAADSDDGSLLEPISLDLDRTQCAALSHFDRAALLSFCGQLQILDRSSRDLLQAMRVLAGIEARPSFRAIPIAQAIFQPSRWDVGRLIQALFPPAAFIAAFVFWVVVDPPTGAKIPMFAGILSLVLLRTPMNPMALLPVLFLSIFLVVAPVYWLLMPMLGSGLELLSLVFVYSLVFGYLGGRSPALKSGPMIMFVTMTGISNQQHYSFQGPVDGALMIVLAGTILTVVYFMFSPMRPEDALLRGIRRFMHGCARITSGLERFGSTSASARGSFARIVFNRWSCRRRGSFSKRNSSSIFRSILTTHRRRYSVCTIACRGCRIDCKHWNWLMSDSKVKQRTTTTSLPTPAGKWAKPYRAFSIAGRVSIPTTRLRWSMKGCRTCRMIYGGS